MARKQKVQAMPKRGSRRGSQRTQMNPGEAGPAGALAEARGKPPRSGPPGAEGNNTRRDFVKLPRRSRKQGG
jgi:hypothetical protein